MLEADAQAIAHVLKRYEYSGDVTDRCVATIAVSVFFVPDDTLLVQEATSLGIRSPE